MEGIEKKGYVGAMRITEHPVLWAIIILALLVVGALILISLYFYNMAIQRNSKQFLSDNKDLVPTEPTPIPFDGPKWVDGHSPETWHIHSHDGLELVAYYLTAQPPTTKTVVLAHGYSGCGKDMGLLAKYYYEQLGYNVLMPDDRGHGASEGDYIGFGWADRLDYLRWIHKLIENQGEDIQIVLHGISMGGATVMMLSGETLPPQVKVIVEDCGYTSVYDQLAYQLRRMYKMQPFPLLHTTSLLTKLKAGYSFSEASSLKQLEKNKLPMLFIHGVDDTFVPAEMIWTLYNACKTEKDILLVEGASHGMAYITDKATYEQKVSDFIGRFIK